MLRDSLRYQAENVVALRTGHKNNLIDELMNEPGRTVKMFPSTILASASQHHRGVFYINVANFNSRTVCRVTELHNNTSRTKPTFISSRKENEEKEQYVQITFTPAVNSNVDTSKVAAFFDMAAGKSSERTRGGSCMGVGACVRYEARTTE